MKLRPAKRLARIRAVEERKRTILFTNNKGEQLNIPAAMTIRDMIECGITWKIVKPEEPLEDGWFREEFISKITVS